MEPRPCGGASLLPRHPRGEALLNDERPATRRANGSRAFLGEVFDPASAWRTRSSPAAQRARGEAAERRRSRPSTSARRIPLHSHRHPGDESVSGRTHRARRCITPQPDGDCGRVEPASPHPQARAYTLASRGDRASRPGGQERPQSAARCVGSTRNVAHGVAPDNPLQHSIQSGSDQGRATDATRVWTTGRARGRRDQQQAQQTSRHTTPLQQPGFFEVLRAPSCSPRERQAMSVISGPVWSGEVAVPQRAINRGTGQ